MTPFYIYTVSSISEHIKYNEYFPSYQFTVNIYANNSVVEE